MECKICGLTTKESELDLNNGSCSECLGNKQFRFIRNLALVGLVVGFVALVIIVKVLF